MNEFKLKLYQRILLFYLLFGLFRANFTDYLYYFKLDVIQLTQFQYALLALVGSVLTTAGIMIYSIFLRKKETRTLVVISILVMAVACVFDLALTLKWYEKLGIKPFTFLFFTSSTLFPLIIGLFIIPPFVLIAKISPTHVEATIFAFSASVINGCLFFVPRMMGLLWNKLFFHVDAENLDNLYKCYLLELVGILLLLPFVKLIPRWEEVEEVQAHLADLNLDAKTPSKIARQESIEPYEGESGTLKETSVASSS